VPAAVEKALQKPALPRMPAVSLRLRARTSPAVRRCVPRRVALALAVRSGERCWGRQPERELAIATMERILKGSEREHEIEQLARRRLIEEEATREIFWAPWRFPPPSETTARRIGELRSSGRALLFSGCHLGPHFLQFAALPGFGFRAINVSGEWMFEQPTRDLWGRRVARWERGVVQAGSRQIPAIGSFAAVRALLEMGEPVAMHFDVPGSIRTPFLGKPVDLASGTSQLAHQTGALVVPMQTRREGTRVRIELLGTVDPHDFESPMELHRALAAIHERSILEVPHTLEDPARAGSWHAGATAAAWLREPAA
jgi:hypothetical protein